MTSIKPIEIDKQIVWQSYIKVKSNGGAAGIDNLSIEEFDADLKGNLYKLWNRMSSGSYFPPPVKRVEIPKSSGGVRALGIPTVGDRIAQMVVKHYLEPQLEPVFDPDSYGYRPKKSAKDAVSATRERCWQFDWVVEFDIRGAFDNIDHKLLMKALRHHNVPSWIELYIKRWLVAPFVDVEGTVNCRTRGIPQGGVISPLLMNLFLHYAFDTWIRRTYPSCAFARYADDAVVHCRTKRQADLVFKAIEARLNVCSLSMHPDKSAVVYCKDSNRKGKHTNLHFTFLGFTFRARSAINRRGIRFTSFLPAVSSDALKRMRGVIKTWRLVRRTPSTLQDFSDKYNRTLRGWWQYYGAFYPTEMYRLSNYLNLKLAYWARRKYKRLAGHPTRSRDWIKLMRTAQPWLFVHWEKSVG